MDASSPPLLRCSQCRVLQAASEYSKRQRTSRTARCRDCVHAGERTELASAQAELAGVAQQQKGVGRQLAKQLDSAEQIKQQKAELGELQRRLTAAEKEVASTEQVPVVVSVPRAGLSRFGSSSGCSIFHSPCQAGAGPHCF